MAYKLTQAEKDAHVMMKNLLKKPIKLKASDFKPGKAVLFTYRPKNEHNPFDMSPMILSLRRSKKYTLGLNLNWTPPKHRNRLINYIMKKNKKNIRDGKEIELSYAMIKTIIKGMGPVIRLYINRRISPKGVVIPSYQYYKMVNLRAESFIGISAEEAWNIAVKKHKTKKKFNRKKRKGSR